MENAEQLVKLIQALGVDESKVQALIEKATPAIIEAARKGIEPTREQVIVRPNAANVTISEHTHPCFKKVLQLVSMGMHVLLIGPAGCGKSWVTEQVAKALGRAYGVLHGTAGASESHIQGWLLPIGQNGQFTYVPAEFVSLWEKGNSLFCLDELDAYDPNMLIVLNGALASGVLHIPQRFQDPHVVKGNDAGIIATANTFGTGADILYAGRNQLDAATLDRFYPIVMDYDKVLEQKLANQFVLDWCWRLREKVATLKLRRVISTRTIMKAAKATGAGIDWGEVRRDLLTGWTRDELAKVGELQT